MKTAVLNEVADGIIYNARLQALAKHDSFVPRACASDRAKTKGKIERPYRYIRQDFFLSLELTRSSRNFRDLEDLKRSSMSGSLRSRLQPIYLLFAARGLKPVSTRLS
jgi:transposase